MYIIYIFHAEAPTESRTLLLSLAGCKQVSLTRTLKLLLSSCISPERALRLSSNRLGRICLARCVRYVSASQTRSPTPAFTTPMPTTTTATVTIMTIRCFGKTPSYPKMDRSDTVAGWAAAALSLSLRFRAILSIAFLNVLNILTILLILYPLLA